MLEIDVLIEEPAWESAALEGLADRACTAALADLGLDPSLFAISIVGCDDARIASLNADFRGKPAPTNVLSWPAEQHDCFEGEMPVLPVSQPGGPPVELGDIAIAYSVCTVEAADQSKPFDHHVTHLLIHATLHLLGFDHINDADAGLMEQVETRILATLGIPDPY